MQSDLVIVVYDVKEGIESAASYIDRIRVWNDGALKDKKRKRVALTIVCDIDIASMHTHIHAFIPSATA